MSQDFWAAIALLMIFEGLMPMLSPARWKDAMRAALALDDRHVRAIGIGCTVLGLLMLNWIRG